MKLLTLFIIIFMNIPGLHGQSIYTIKPCNMNVKGTTTAEGNFGIAVMNSGDDMIVHVKTEANGVPAFLN